VNDESGAANARSSGSATRRDRGEEMHARRGDRWVAPVDPPDVLRLFYAVPVPPAARESVGALIDKVQAGVGDGTARIRWVHVEGLHLTLRFLGATPERLRPALEAAADEIARGSEPFDVSLSGGGAFPSLSRPRSLWVGVQEGGPELAALAEELSRRSADVGLVLETRPFAAHLTIGRTDGVRLGPAAARALADAASAIDVRFTADRIVLFRSQLGGGPARYEALHEARLGG
jgi:RNA 2',3'-cyclic 3'-phosphodiesterase